MNQIIFKIHSLLDFHLEMVEFPELHSSHKWVQKGIDILKHHFPKFLGYLSKQKILSHLKECSVIIITKKEHKESQIKTTFKVWIQKEKAKRLVYVIIEGIILPFTGILALLPGPNFFFYVPALLLYYHLKSYLGLKRADVDEMDIEIRHHD